MANPLTLLAPLNGSLSARDRAGIFTLTSTGAVKYRAAIDPTPVNPMTFLAPLNGSLAYQDRGNGGTLTGSGAVRYQAAENARTNLVLNPRLSSATTGYSLLSGATITRVTTDGVFGSTSLRVSSAASTGSGVLCSGTNKMATNVIHTFSFWAKWVSGGTNWESYASCRFADGLGNGTTSATAITINNDGEWHQYSVQLDPSSRVGTDGMSVRIVRPSSPSDASEILVTALCLETGTVASPAYFDGSTGGVWLNPITGILGTAHASPSVSLAAAWIEEGTTNLVRNPSGETNTTDWTASSATVTRDTTYALFGSYSFKIVTSNATANEGIVYASAIIPATVGQTFTITCYLRGSGTVVIGVDEFSAVPAYLASGAGSVITLTDSWTRYTLTYTTVNASCASIRPHMRTDVQQSITFYMDGVQVEQKAYATSYCDGAIGTGYAWSGTAHASSSTRTQLGITGVPASTGIDVSKGSLFTRFTRLYDTGGAVTAFIHFEASTRITMTVDASDKLQGQFGTGGARTDTVNNTVGTWYNALMDWDMVNLRGRLFKDNVQVGADLTIAGMTTLSTSFRIGSTGASTGAINGLMRDVAILSDVLTSTDRATVSNASALTFGLLPATYYTRARVNYCSNPGTGTNTTGWSGAGGGSVADSDFVGGRAIETSSLALNSGTGITVQMRNANLLSGTTVTVGFDVKKISGPDVAGGITVYLRSVDAAGGFPGSATTQSYTPTGSVQRIVKTFTLPADVGMHGVYIQVVRNSDPGNTGNIVCRFSRVTVEAGATNGSWFEPVWIDPITGIGGTAHNSPSVSLAGIFPEETTTNLILDPLTAGTPAGVALRGAGTNVLNTDYGRSTVHAYSGSGSWWRSGDGTNNTRGLNIATATSLGYTGSIKTFSGQLKMRVTGGPYSIIAGIQIAYTDATYSSVVSQTKDVGDEWVQFSFTGLASDSAKTVNSIIAYSYFNGIAGVGVTSFMTDVQIEEKSYITSLCAGSLGTGYSWSGTADASSSTRAACDISATASGHINGLVGSLTLKGLQVFPGAGGRCYVDTGPTGAGKDRIAVDSGSTQISAWFVGNNVAPAGYIRAGAVSTTGAWDMAYAEWNGTATGVAEGSGTKTTGTRNTPSGDLSTSFWMGRNTSASVSAYLNGVLRDVAVFERLLSDAERLRIETDLILDWMDFADRMGGVIAIGENTPNVSGILSLGSGS